MSIRIKVNRHSVVSALAMAMVIGTVSLSKPVSAQQMPMNSQPAAQTDTANQTQTLQDQVTELKEQVAKLQAALQSKAKPSTTKKKGMSSSQAPMAMEDDSAEMGAMGSSASPQQAGSMAPMKDEMGEMGGSMKGGMAKRGMTMPMSDSGCCGMNSMGKPMGGKHAGMSGGAMSGKSTGAMAPGSSGSVFTEPPSLLHLGAKDFYLDHADHVGLTPEQRASLEKIKMSATEQKTNSQKQIDRAEAELWQLTGVDQPNTGDIDKKVQEIAKLRAEQQTAYIHSVAEAAKVLTPQQQEAIMKPMPTGAAKKM